MSDACSDLQIGWNQNVDNIASSKMPMSAVKIAEILLWGLNDFWLSALLVPFHIWLVIVFNLDVSESLPKVIYYPWHNSRYMRHIWVTCMNLDTQWTLRWESYGFWFEIKHFNFNEHFSINTSSTTIRNMTWIFFDIINLDTLGYHKLLHRRSSMDISTPTSWPPPSQTW